MRQWRRWLAGIGRWSVRLLLGVALLNLGHDLWTWRERIEAEGERRFFRNAEQADDIDYGIAELRIVNETGRDYLIDSLVLDGWGGPLTHRPEHMRSLARAGREGSSRAEERYIDRLVSPGVLELRDSETGARRVERFRVDRRRPTSCSMELRITDDGATVSECRMLPRIRHDFRWLFGPPTQYD
jgi:hypothetical protein